MGNEMLFNMHLMCLQKDLTQPAWAQQHVCHVASGNMPLREQRFVALVLVDRSVHSEVPPYACLVRLERTLTD
jgi:hypothetical protein